MSVSIPRIIAIGIIYLATCVGWGVLGEVTSWRGKVFAERLGHQVKAMWGATLVQQAPIFTLSSPPDNQSANIAPMANDIQVVLDLDYRKKGLIWYPTYISTFDGKWTVANESEIIQRVTMDFTFPIPSNTYDDFVFTVDDEPVTQGVNTAKGIQHILAIPAGESRVVRIGYQTRGMTEWRYRNDPNLGRVRDFKLTVETDFIEVDYPPEALSPRSAEEQGQGMLMSWETQDRLTHADIGVIIPEKLNPGPLASRITFFAPVCLLFFFVLVMTVNIVSELRIHPMHYLFVAAGFFAFHLLLAYLVNVLPLYVAFAIGSVVSVLLVTLYLRAALGPRFPTALAASGQIFFLVLFSYSFFIDGLTGLTVAIGSVLTLAVLMKVTAATDWEQVFGSKHDDADESEPAPTDPTDSPSLPLPPVPPEASDPA